MSSLAAHLKPRFMAALEAQTSAIRELGECYWTLRVDNAGVQPKSAQG